MYGIADPMHFEAVAPVPPPLDIVPTSFVSQPAVIMSNPAAFMSGAGPWQEPAIEQLYLLKTIVLASQSPVIMPPPLPAGPDPAAPVPAAPVTGAGNAP